MSVVIATTADDDEKLPLEKLGSALFCSGRNSRNREQVAPAL